MRASSAALTFLALLLAVFGGLFLVDGPSLEDKRGAHRKLVAQYGLTDLALFTEARYTRHPSQADLHASQQDHPAAFEHFPSGSLITPANLPVYRHAKLAGKTTSPD